ncbi:MAG: cation diffusion facilitator family transporter [Halobacteriales archaeon]
MSRGRTLRRLGLVILAGNAALLAAKGVVWLESGSLAVGSEAINSLTDVAYGVLVVGGIHVSVRPPDRDHPHGHERIEPFVALAVILGFVLAGVAVLWGALEALARGEVVVARGPWAVAVLGVSAAGKYLLYRYSVGVADEYDAPAARALAVDNRNDILTALAAMAGVAGAQFGLAVADPIAAAVVAIVIIYSGVTLARRNVDFLTGAAPSPKLRERIVEVALAHPEVEGVHDVLAHYVGPEVDVSLHIEVGEDLTLAEGHAIETAVIQALEELPEVDEAFVHLDPKDLDEWKPGTFAVEE